MAEAKSLPGTVEEYIAQFPPSVQALLRKYRAAILEAAPGAEEKMAYRMPAYWKDGPLVYFAAFKKHIGFYPLPEAIEEFKERLAPYAQAKGSVQFPIDGDPPLDLVKAIVRNRLAANARKAKAKKK